MESPLIALDARGLVGRRQFNMAYFELQSMIKNKVLMPFLSNIKNSKIISRPAGLSALQRITACLVKNLPGGVMP
jgi:hypothetical protein